MNTYETEEQQIEAIKNWWKENGKAFIIGAVIGVGALMGGKAWLDYREGQRQSASIEFARLSDELRQNQTQSVTVHAEHIIENFANTPYGPLAALTLAKIKVEAGELDAAQSKLQWVLAHAKQNDIIHMARLRLARVMSANGQYQQALALLDNVDYEGYAAAYHEVRGDIQLAMQQQEAARASYNAALTALQAGDDRRQLQMKLADVGG